VRKNQPSPGEQILAPTRLTRLLCQRHNWHRGLGRLVDILGQNRRARVVAAEQVRTLARVVVAHCDRCIHARTPARFSRFCITSGGSSSPWMQQIVEEAVVRLGRPASEAARFVQLFQAHWIESLTDYVEHHDSPQLGERARVASTTHVLGLRYSLTRAPAGQVPAKLHAALVGMARERKVGGDDRRSEVRLACFQMRSAHQKKGAEKRLEPGS
jgi:hypothetical protein